MRGAVADVTDHATLDRAIDEAAETYGRLDVAFANAGIDPGVGFVGAWAGGQRPRVEEGALERYTDERWNRVIDINLNGIFATARAAARHMRPRRFGRIIVTTSLAATADRARDRLRLHGGEGRRQAPDALDRARARGRRHHRQRDRARVLRHQHRRWPRA